MRTQTGYVPLADSPDSPSPSVGPDTVCADPSKRWVQLASRLTYLATLVIIICTMLDILVLLFFSLRFRAPSAVLHSADQAEPRSSYINLDVLYSKGIVNSSQHAPIVNHALSFAQVSLTDPEKILPRHRTGFFKEQFGLVPYIERRLLVTPQISTIAQFRAIDFGMESCSLAIMIPPLDKAETDGRLQTTSTPNFTLDVYTLPIRNKLDFRAVSYSTLPTGSLFAQLVPSEATVIQSPTFPCRTLSYHTFLVACADPGCHLDLITTTNREIGLFMYQHQTV